MTTINNFINIFEDETFNGNNRPKQTEGKKVKKKKKKKQKVVEEKPVVVKEQHIVKHEEKVSESNSFPVREAIILSEIIGEPRCKTRFRRGRR